MGKGRSVHIGVNKPQDNFGVQPLSGCAGDAKAMFNIATVKGFQAKPPLIDGAATFKAVEKEVLEAAGDLKDGDTFLFTFAGHGSFSPTDAEEDFQDELILLRDCMVIDDYMRRKWWSKFKQGVRIVAIADCCHSGTVLMASLSGPSGNGRRNGMESGVVAVSSVGTSVAASVRTNARLRERTRREPTVSPTSNRGFTVWERDAIRKANPQIHKKMEEALMSSAGDELKASLLTLAACEDHEFAKDGSDNGAFTAELVKVWDNNNFAGTYKTFMDAIQAPFKTAASQQHPVMQTAFAAPGFVDESPFSI